MGLVGSGIGRGELVAVLMTLGTLLAVKMISVVMSVIVVVPVLSMANLTDTVVDAIAIRVGVVTGSRCENHRLWAAVGCLYDSTDKGTIGSAEGMGIVAHHTTGDVMVQSLCLLQGTEKQNEYR
jgi:hypothetical protein